LLAATFADVSNRNGGTITSAGANLIGDNTTVGSEFPAGALVGTQASPMDPMLLPLGDNGGPTWTMLPLVDSPAIDAAVGTVASPTTDQRGELRPGNLDDDLGAVEVPEPGFAVGLTAGLALLAVLRRRRAVA
jgi:hypothetical protein